MSNRSDYNKKRMKLNELLPKVYRSEFNDSLFENTFNRFFTKPETQTVSGYIGRSTSKVIQNRQIPESDVHRQAFQLQPLVTSKNGTEDVIFSWKDFLNRLKQYGVDVDSLNEWGSVDEFNFAPPIDFDKVINYNNYYWVDASTTPQYITIRSRCTVAQSNLNFWNTIINNFGSFIQLTNVASDGTILSGFNQLIVDGDYRDLFNEGFPIYISGSTNADLNEQTFIVKTRFFFNGQTYITLNTSFTDAQVSGAIDLSKRQLELQNEVDCQCSGSIGWDYKLWDDNPAEPTIWDGDFDTLMSGITWYPTLSDLTPPLATSPWTYGLWYNPINDALYQLNSLNQWQITNTNFSSTLETIDGQALWDMAPNCGIKAIIKQAEQWTDQNKWVHKSDVVNFSTARQAQMPIIEFEWDLELNEWAVTKHKWKYRADSSQPWVTSETEPFLCELMPILAWDVTTTPSFSISPTEMVIKLSEGYGDLTSFFTPNTSFNCYGISTPLTVKYSVYKSELINTCFQTQIVCDLVPAVLSAVPLVNYLYPSFSSKGDLWKGIPTLSMDTYDSEFHWLYDGVESTLPINHVPLNIFTIPRRIEVSPGIFKNINYNSEERNAGDIWNGLFYEFLLETSPVAELINTSLVMSQRALYGQNDVKVYVNEVLQEGNYIELDTGGMVSGIRFDATQTFNDYDIIRVVVGAECVWDIGRENIVLQTAAGQSQISLVRYRKVSQPKYKDVQYPMFDMYSAVGEPIKEVSPIFSFAVDSAYPINPLINERIVVDSTKLNFSFKQHLLQNNKLLAYRDYSRTSYRYWFNSTNRQLFVWDDISLCWTDKIYTPDGYCISPIVSNVEPVAPWSSIDGMVWFDVVNNALFVYEAVYLSWNQITDVVISSTDPTLVTIWKNNPQRPYVPSKVDWKNRTFEQYENERETYVYGRINELYVIDSSKTYTELIELANIEWYASQSNQHSLDGTWVGDWEIPNPLYFNNSHDNRSVLTTRELVTHFRSIIESQPPVPGFTGTNASMYRLIPLNDIDFSRGGTIKEYNHGFTRFLSSVFIGTPTFEQVIDYAKSQYDILLNNIIETSRNVIVDIVSQDPTSEDVLSSLSERVLLEHESNGFYSSIFHDSSISTIKNWIATLPCSRLAKGVTPVYINDDNIGANFIIHHDGHYDGYVIPSNNVQSLVQSLIKIHDARTNSTLGINSTGLPPRYVSDFATQFGVDISNKNGALWFDTSTQSLYRLYFNYISSTSPITPSVGDVWFNVADEKVYYYSNVGWVAPHAPAELYGSDISGAVSAWKIFDINVLFAQTVLSIENRIFDQYVSIDGSLIFNSDDIQTTNPSLWFELEEQSFKQFNIDNGIRAALINDEYLASDPFTWNYTGAVPSLYPAIPTPNITGCWQNVYETLFGTAFPHLEPWKLQGYTTKPIWWDAEYANTDATAYNNRRWKQSGGVGMWTNILLGIVPANKYLPNGQLSLGTPAVTFYSYVPVNISDVDITHSSVTYRPDDLLPPYWNHSVAYGSFEVRSVFKSDTPVPNPSYNYLYGENGTQEFLWKHSIDYAYTKLIISYKIDPIKTFFASFGSEYVTCGNLQIDKLTHKPISHSDTVFHGDVINTNEIYKVLGTNQWYVNFCRYKSFDINNSHVAKMWKTWKAPLSYQLASFVETNTLNMEHNNVDVTQLDYNFATKKVPNVEEFWLHALDTSILEFPATFLRYSSQADWKFELSTPVNVETNINYYGVHRYQFFVDVSTNMCHLHTYPIVGVDVSTIVISGDYVESFDQAEQVEIINSLTNNGLYQIVSVEYNDTVKQTFITIDGVLVNPLDTTGQLKSLYRNLPWVTGDLINLATDGTIPQPLYVDKQYFIIVHNVNTFQFARTQADALSSIPIVITSSGSRNSFVGIVSGSFDIKDKTNNAEKWYTYAIDKSVVKSATLSHQMYGIQNLIDLVCGYDQYLYDQGWRINNDQIYRDTATNRPITWFFELEDFIDFAFFERSARTIQNQQSFVVTYNDSDGVFEFDSYTSSHTTGDAIKFSSVDGPLPAGIESHVTYYMIRVTDSMFKIAFTARDAKIGTHISGINTSVGQGVVSISTPRRKRAIVPHKFINPIREGVWFIPNKGIVSNVLANVENFGKHCLFTQTGMPVKSSNIQVYRQDNITHISVIQSNSNDVLAVARVNVDYYEHVIQFNNYTVANDFIYDPFIGLNATKFEMEFERQPSDKQRPTLGGYVLSVDANGNRLMTRNIEGNIDDLRYAYDHTLNRMNPFVQQAQKTIGYVKETTSLDSLRISPKSQFEFWKGMIQHKGSINSIKAFINSKRFIDAKVDEFWAIKIAEYGTIAEREYPELRMFMTDSLSSDVRFQFTTPGDIVEDGFIEINDNDKERWYDQPLQHDILADNEYRMYFTAKPFATFETTLTTFVGSITHNLNCPHVVCTIEDGLGNVSTVTPSVINNNVVEITSPLTGTFTVWALLVDVAAHTPLTIIDNISNTKISNIIFWDPEHNYHDNNVFSQIDIVSSKDPALYTNTMNQTTNPDVPAVIESIAVWNDGHVGTTWLNTSNVGFVPYNDSKIFPAFDDRLKNWGTLSDWATYDVLEWVKSDVPPSEWDVAATNESGNVSIEESVRKSGTAVKTIFRRNDLISPWYIMAPSVWNTHVVSNGSTIFDLSVNMIDVNVGDKIDLYNNGKLVHTFDYAPLFDISTITPTIQPQDYITFVRQIPLDEEAIAALVATNLYRYDYQYTQIKNYDRYGGEYFTYYFWVRNKTTRTKHNIAPKFINEQLNIPTLPYVVPHGYDAKTSTLPDRVSKIAICGIQGIIRDNNRYILRLTKDFSLRDPLTANENIKALKHEEWKIFRQEQLFNIDKWMWDLITESIVGYKLTNTSIRVPSYDKELYDIQFNSDTRFGLETGQAFVDGNIAKQTVLSYLQRQDIDFYPINIGAFLNENNFNTAENSIALMEQIYNTFSYVHVNRIFFSVLMDALSCKRKYPGLMKTSMVALHGIKPFQVGGIFDD